MPVSVQERPAPSLRSADAPAYAVRPVRRRAALARYGMFAVVATGPLALAVLVLSPHTASRPAASRPAVSARAAQPSDPGGAAAVFVDLWLRSDVSRPDASAAQALHALAPQVPLVGYPNGTPVAPLATAVLRSTRLTDGSWSVVVAAELPATDSAEGSAHGLPGVRMRYFAVQVSSGTGSGGAGALTVTAAPSEIAGPTAAPRSGPSFSTAVPQGPLASAMGEFFSSYLAGVGPVGPFLAPGARLATPTGAGYKAVRVDQVMGSTDAAASTSVPKDGTRVQIQAQVTATDSSGGSWPLLYVLSLASRAGRWEVSAIQAGGPTPAVTSSAEPTAATSGGVR